MSQLFSQTLREAPNDAEVASHILLLRAGFMRQLASGVFSYLPLAQRALGKIEAIIRAEMEAIGGQEIKMPVVHSAEVWKESGRYLEYDDSLTRFEDRHGRDMVLATTHEEIAADLARKEIKSYRQLPQMIYHFQTKWRDEARPTSGLLRVREFTMKDSYSLDATQEGLERQYIAHHQAYFNIFRRCGIPIVAVAADSGIMGGKVSHEFMFLSDVGEDTIVRCEGCGYSANGQVAEFARSEPVAADPAVMERIATPETKTIEDLAQLLDIESRQTAKAVFFMGRYKDEDGEGDEEKLIFAVVRGDLEVNETKVANAAGALELRPAHDDEIKAVGAVAGYASPIGLQDVLVIADESIPAAANLVAGANEDGFHMKDVNYGRDWEATTVADIASAGEGDACHRCGKPLSLARGVEVGNIFQLGTRFTDALGASFLDENGRAQSIIMGSYGIGVGRLLACVAEHSHDDAGCVWPVTIAPYQVHLVSLAKSDGDARTAAEGLYAELISRGIEVLYDDRKENPGVKFNDADLIGCPVRITVGDRGLKKEIMELKVRTDEGKGDEVPVADIAGRVEAILAELRAAIEATVVEEPYEP
ncbi:MAG: proline--tRNA ligase [Candidatus Latescibacteria bacterium]|jgi:prolyl-tRNA synthetase|nr:proline--tRNA ligase [Gemmatimonadaceae bacterium]MDP6017180.1 proline--tRNA ligase [Candidatus Latescibacterota bacterium]MDP7450419.1 proline--tRNA ligase [Candidatus Latescibacterota bacterium]HJP30940.1 proline--tRNA ligase [Candidatus Latescibacterota bacterium]